MIELQLHNPTYDNYSNKIIWSGNLNQPLKLYIDYPLKNPTYCFVPWATTLTEQSLMKFIVEKYTKIYNEEFTTMRKYTIKRKLRHFGKHEIWGHSMQDLIMVDYKIKDGIISLTMKSTAVL